MKNPVISIFSLVIFSGCVSLAVTGASSNVKRAICYLTPGLNASSKVKGKIMFSQEGQQGNLYITASVEGLTPNQNHGIHVHQFDNLTDGCISLGAHFNLENKTHGGPTDQIKHTGDLGNIRADANGKFHGRYRAVDLTLYTNKTIIGRSVIVHEKPDDLGRGNTPDSPKTGNSGPRIGCGVIKAVGISVKAKP